MFILAIEFLKSNNYNFKFKICLPYLPSKKYDWNTWQMSNSKNYSCEEHISINSLQLVWTRVASFLSLSEASTFLITSFVSIFSCAAITALVCQIHSKCVYFRVIWLSGWPRVHMAPNAVGPHSVMVLGVYLFICGHSAAAFPVYLTILYKHTHKKKKKDLENSFRKWQECGISVFEMRESFEENYDNVFFYVRIIL